jgi:uncharacterized membrane protein YraQ (UPF0718 family)
VSGVLEVLWHGLRDSLLMAWEVWWALVLGFAISAIVQTWVPRGSVERALAGSGPRPVTLATGLGAASSSCSYAAVAIARSLFAKGASSATALAFQFASTNLVWELGLVLWVLIGWQFTLAEYVGGVVMIALMAVLLRPFVPARVEARARARVRALGAGGPEVGEEDSGGVLGGIVRAGELPAVAVGAGPPTPPPGVGPSTPPPGAGSPTPPPGVGPSTPPPGVGGHCHHAASLSEDPEEAFSDWRERLRSRSAWSRVARSFRMDWRMLYREIAAGFLLAGFVAQLGNGFFEGLFIHDAPAPLPAIESAIVGPLIAVLSFVCSVGNVPLAAVLWSGGIGFSGVLAFLFADLIVLPIVAIYRKFYGSDYALRTVALMLLTMILAALAVTALFGALGLIPTGPRPTRADIFGTVGLDYKLILNLLGLLVFAVLYRLGARRPERGGGELALEA